jgi:hypothetical protein
MENGQGSAPDQVFTRGRLTLTCLTCDDSAADSNFMVDVK